MTKPTPEEIIRDAEKAHVVHGAALDIFKALTDAGKVIVDRELTEAKRNEIGETISRMRHTATGGVVAIAVHAIIIGQDTGS